MSQTVKAINFRGWEALVNRNARIFPYFTSALRRRVIEKRATNVVVTGEPGQGKSYQAADFCRVLEGITKGGKERFKLDQVVFRYRDFMRLTLRLPMGKPIVFDEPSYAMGKRDWFKEINKALVLTIESKRFKIHPMFIPIINKALLDKTIRSYLIQFQVEMRDRGRAVVYRIEPAQHSDKIYRKTFCVIEYNMLDWDLCQKDSCLDCAKLSPAAESQKCQIFRARYERKKAAIQDVRYEQAFDQATTKESQELTNNQVVDLLFEHRALFINEEGDIDVSMLRIIAEDKCSVKVGHTRSYTIKKLFKYRYPSEFEKV